jgi:NADH-ubiquinone oxidoreductase chain 5
MNYERVRNGLFTMFQNRIGDLFFVLFLVLNMRLRRGVRLSVECGVLFLIIGACVKRAQFPFNSWLLAAMRAPTPISSLVHSSTLVVAGVYVVLQYSYCLGGRLEILQFLSLLTLFFRRVGLLGEIDIKKLIAYSTISHVALIIFILRFQLFKVVYFHLNVHALFKSLIFICFGFVILVSYHRQDKRLIRGAGLNPLIKMIYYFSGMCLAGLPFLRAFFF